MSSFSRFTNMGAYFRSYRAGAGTATAGGTGDNTKVTSSYLDRNPSGFNFRSCKLVISYTTTLAAAATLSFTVTPRDATDSSGTGVADYTYSRSLAKTVVATGPGGGGTVADTIELDIDLSACREYIGFDITPDLSAANTDTLSWVANVMMGGDDREPTSKTL